MITRSVYRTNLDLFWKTMQVILVEICGYSKEQADNITCGHRRVHEAASPRKKGSYVKYFTPQRIASSYAVQRIDKQPPFDDELKNQWIDQVRPLIDDIEIRLWGASKRAKFPERVWNYIEETANY